MTRAQYNAAVNRMFEKYGDEIEQLMIDLELIPLSLIPDKDIKDFIKRVYDAGKDKSFDEPTRIDSVYLRAAKKRAKERKKKFEENYKKRYSLFNR